MSSEMRSKTVESTSLLTSDRRERARQGRGSVLWTRREKLIPALLASPCKQDTEDTLCGQSGH